MAATATLPPARQLRHPRVPAGCPLTDRELRTLELIAEGLTYKQAAQRRGVSAATVRTHVHNAMSRLGVATSAQAVITGFKAGWIRLDSIDSPHAPRVARAPRETAEQRKVTPAQRLYLLAFDLHLRSRGDDQRAASRAVMTSAPRVAR